MEAKGYSKKVVANRVFIIQRTRMSKESSKTPKLRLNLKFQIRKELVTTSAMALFVDLINVSKLQIGLFDVEKWG